MARELLKFSTGKQIPKVRSINNEGWVCAGSSDDSASLSLCLGEHWARVSADECSEVVNPFIEIIVIQVMIYYPQTH